MGRTLHVTNGDAIVPEIESVAPDDPVLPWRDVLHEGPVPGGLDEAGLRVERALFLARSGWGDGVLLLDAFERRDATLGRGAAAGPITLWFENDLYDQLQLIQVLSMLDARVDRDASHRLVDVSREREVVGERDVGHAARQAARRAWAAFRSSDPRVLPALDPPELPDVGPALRRLVQELPWTTDGLSRTERAALEAIAAGADDPIELFRAVQAAEERPFMGDHWVWATVHRLASGPHPLVEEPVAPGAEITADFAMQRYALTEAGADVLDGRVDQVELNGIDRWLGGVHLERGRPGWRWDPHAGEVVA